MKNFFFFLGLSALLLSANSCRVPEITFSYNSFVNYLITDFQQRQDTTLSLPDSSCQEVYQVLYPYCGKINRHLEERTMENTLALDGQCDGPVQTYHRFSLIIFDNLKDASPAKDTVLFFSAHLKDYTDPLRVKTDKDTVTALGAVTIYIGNFKNDTTIHFFKRLVFTKASPCKIPLFCFSRENRVKGAPVRVRMDMILKKPYRSDPSRRCQAREIQVSRIIENDLNEISEHKPLVFNIQDVFKIDHMNYRWLTCNCNR